MKKINIFDEYDKIDKGILKRVDITEENEIEIASEYINKGFNEETLGSKVEIIYEKDEDMNINETTGRRYTSSGEFESTINDAETENVNKFREMNIIDAEFEEVITGDDDYDI